MDNNDSAFYDRFVNIYFPHKFFTNEETFELIGQHETETGQLFDPSVKKEKRAKM